MQHVAIRVPATSANLGPGFDCMGMALRWYAGVRVARSTRFSLAIRGYGAATLPRGENNLVHVSFARAYARMNKAPPIVAIRCNNTIPLNRGLGSSSAAIVAGLTAANALEGSPLDVGTLLALATGIEGHPDNVAPALLGGLQVVTDGEAGLSAAAVRLKSGLRGIVFVPDAELSTKKARGVLPKQVSRADAVFNAGRTALLVLALSQGRWELLGEATQDRLHQPRRAGLFPPMLPLFHAARAAGARGVFLSGAGPAVLALTDSDPAIIATAFERAAQRAKAPGVARIVGLAARGAHVAQSS